MPPCHGAFSAAEGDFSPRRRRPAAAAAVLPRLDFLSLSLVLFGARLFFNNGHYTTKKLCKWLMENSQWLGNTERKSIRKDCRRPRNELWEMMETAFQINPIGPRDFFTSAFQESCLVEAFNWSRFDISEDRPHKMHHHSSGGGVVGDSLAQILSTPILNGANLI